MTLPELQAFVDHHPHEGLELRLAQRLARSGEFELAERYFPAATPGADNLRALFHTYVADVRLGFDSSRPAPERAAAFWRAAVAMRDHGDGLLGSELETSYAPFPLEHPADDEEIEERRQSRLAGGALAATPDELRRLEDAQTPAERRFRHYRYRAADLAWWAASLMPNDSEATAEILREAGTWLAPRDPAAAEKFYQALVIRCGQTPLGRAAAKKRWFPEDVSAGVADSPRG